MDREGFWAVSDLLNHLYCARITWWSHVMGVPQRATPKTRRGQEAHETWAGKEERRRYEGTELRTRRKRVGLTLTSERLGLRGRLDALVDDDGDLLPWDEKNTEQPERPWPGHRLQMGAYALLLEEAFPGTRVDRGVIDYLIDGTSAVIPITPELRAQVLEVLEELNQVRGTERLPPRAPWTRCRDCVYAKICLVP